MRSQVFLHTYPTYTLVGGLQDQPAKLYCISPKNIVYPSKCWAPNWSSLQCLLTKCLHDQEQRWPSVIIQLVAGTTGPLDTGPETRNLAAPPHHHRCIYIPTLDIYWVQRPALILMITQIRGCRIFICSCLSPSSQISSSLSQKSLPQKHLHSHHYQLCRTFVM